MLGAFSAETCETAEGTKTFPTPSYADSFRTPDGRIVSARRPSTVEEHRTRMLESLILDDRSGRGSGLYGDEVAALITKLIGANALTESEIQNAVRIIHEAFERPNRSQSHWAEPSATVLLLQNLESQTQQESLKQEIAETINYVQLQ
jgi:hypothetical protein